MPENDELHQQIQSLRRELHGVGKPWYERSPGKEIVAHAAAITTAVGIGLVVHKWTGGAVVIEAKHMCMMMRGVEKQNSSMITSVMLGEFRENAATRSEFLSLIK